MSDGWQGIAVQFMSIGSDPYMTHMLLGDAVVNLASLISAAGKKYQRKG